MFLNFMGPAFIRERVLHTTDYCTPDIFIGRTIYLSIYLSMALLVEPFVGPWPLFQFLDLYTVGRPPSTGDQPVARPLPTHRKTHTE
jgi:hypothetical protein